MKIFSKEIKQLIARRVLAEIERLKPQKHASYDKFYKILKKYNTSVYNLGADHGYLEDDKLYFYIVDSYDKTELINNLSKTFKVLKSKIQVFTLGSHNHYKVEMRVKLSDIGIKESSPLDYQESSKSAIEEAMGAGQIEEAINIDSTGDVTDAFIGSEELEATYKEGFFDADELSGELEHEIRDRRYFALAVQDKVSQNKGLVFFKKTDQQEVQEYMSQFVDLNKQLKQAKPGEQEQLNTEIEGLYDALPLENEIALNKDEVDELSRRGYDFLKSNFSF